MRGSRVNVGLHWAIVLVGVLVIGGVRAPLIERYQKSTAGDEVSLLLSPQYTVLFSLGHREALADYLFASALVQYGTSFQEKQRFDAAYRYLDTITTLAPKYPKPYLFVDTLLTMRSSPARREDYFDARRLHERGLAELPYFTELWSVAGQFAAYLAPPYLPDAERVEFRRAGVRYLSRACQLASNNANIPYHCIAAAKLLNRSGEREAMMRMLSNTLAVNDDPEVRRMALSYLAEASNDRLRERYARRGDALSEVWKASLPHASRNLLSLLGPGPKIWQCAGAAASRSPGCFTTWRDWGEITDRAE